MDNLDVDVIEVCVNLGIAALFLIPFRLWQFYRGRLSSIRTQLKVAPRFLALLGQAGLILAFFGWLAIPVGLFNCPPWKPFCDLVAFMPLVLLGPGYLIVELLLLPITYRQLKRQPEVPVDS